MVSLEWIKPLVARSTTVVMIPRTLLTPWTEPMAWTMVKPIVRFKVLPGLGHLVIMTVIAKGERVYLPIQVTCVPARVAVRDANKRVRSSARPDFFAYH